MKKIPVKELDAILKEVGDKLEPVVKAEVAKAAEKLAKANPGESTTDEVPKDDSATKEAPDDKASAPPKGDDKPAPEAPKDAPKDAPPADPPPADAPPADAPPADAPPGAEDPACDPEAGDCDSPEALQAAYAALPIEERIMHYLAVKAAVMAEMPPAAPEADPALAAAPPPAAPPVAAPPAAPPMADPALKAEMPADPNGSVEAVKKSEKLVEDLTKKVADQQKIISELIDLSAALKKHIERAPLRKSIATISEVRRNGPGAAAPTVDFASLNKSEMKAIVRKTADKELSPADRGRLNAFIAGKYEDVESVKDLLVVG